MQGLVVHFEVFLFLVTPLLVYVFLVEVIIFRWNERRNKFLVVQVLPWKFP